MYFESPTNPNLKLIDIEAVASIAHAHNPEIKVIVDNTFCTPFLQRPVELGADVVIHSATKYLNGHGDVIAGMAAGKAEARELYDAYCYGIAKEVGALSTVLKGEVDAVLVTGGIAYSKYVIEQIAERVSWIAPVKQYGGEDEMLALTQGVLRVLNGEEAAKEYK